MSLKDTLVTTPPREESGSVSSDRFQYQRHWALLKLLNYHLQEPDYVFIFDYHDDVLILDSDENPTKIKFYQIKTKGRNNWTLAALTKQEEGESSKEGESRKLPSILGKMYLNKVNFKDQVESLNFVSNARFNLKLDDATEKDTKDRVYICASEISAEEVSKVKNALKEELKVEPDTVSESIIFFEVSDLPLQNHETQVKGALVDFLQKLFPQRKFSIVPIYQSIIGEITRRNNHKLQQYTIEELTTKKCLSKKDFEKFIIDIGIGNDQERNWQSVESRLNAEGCSYAQVMKIKSQWNLCEIHRLDITNDTFQKNRATVKVLLNLHLLK